MSIREFLLTRIAADEAKARAVLATVAPDEWENPTQWGNFYQEDIEFWNTVTPQRILAECKAKRAIVDEHGPGESWHRDYCETCAEWWRAEVGEGPPGVAYPCPTLRAVAAVYKDHPGYRQEWARG